jgi:hypothetical protein
MDLVTRNRLAITRLMATAERRLPVTALLFLERLLGEPAALQVGRLCATGEWGEIQSLIQIDTNRSTWQARVGGAPVALEPEALVTRLMAEPVWFLCVSGARIEPLEADPILTDRAARLFASLESGRIRRIALLDQIDAALDDGDRETYDRLQRLLQELTPQS